MPGAVRTCKFAVKARVPARPGRTQARAAEPREAVKTVDHPTAGAGPDGPEPRLGGVRVLGRYRLQQRLGAGGFGVVWMARDEHLGRAVAVKRIPMHDAASAARAEREGLAAARLGHPGVVALYEAGRDAGAVYLVSELVRGSSLADLIAQGALSDRDVLLIGIALCDALAHAHSRGVVHRDVKPGNVLVPESAHDLAGVAKLTDFGVARMSGDEALTRTGDVVGTLAYMAPEQAEGARVTPACDVYSLALTLYECWSGENPNRRATPAATARAIGARVRPLRRLRPDLPRELSATVDECLAARPTHRPSLETLGSAIEEGLDRLDDSTPGEARPLLGRLLALGGAATLGVWLAAGHGVGLP
jgi:serine/threonine protein kinase